MPKPKPKPVRASRTQLKRMGRPSVPKTHLLSDAHHTAPLHTSPAAGNDKRHQQGQNPRIFEDRFQQGAAASKAKPRDRANHPPQGNKGPVKALGAPQLKQIRRAESKPLAKVKPAPSVRKITKPARRRV